jgi:hypothetical protein
MMVLTVVWPALPRRGSSSVYTAKPPRRKTVWTPSRPSGVVPQLAPACL